MQKHTEHIIIKKWLPMLKEYDLVKARKAYCLEKAEDDAKAALSLKGYTKTQKNQTYIEKN